MYTSGFCISKILEEIRIMVIVIFCVWTSHSQNTLFYHSALFALKHFVLTVYEKVHNFLGTYNDILMMELVKSISTSVEI